MTAQPGTQVVNNNQQYLGRCLIAREKERRKKKGQANYRNGSEDQNIDDGPFFSQPLQGLIESCLSYPPTGPSWFFPLKISWLKGKPAFIIPNKRSSPCYFRDVLEEVMCLTVNYAWHFENLPGCFPSHSFSEKNLGPFIPQKLFCESQVSPRHCFFFLWLSFKPLTPKGESFPAGFLLIQTLPCLPPPPPTSCNPLAHRGKEVFKFNGKTVCVQAGCV